MRLLAIVREKCSSLIQAAQQPSWAGLILIAAAAVAMLLENSGLRGFYHSCINYELGFSMGGFELNRSIAHWISDGLMVLFFLGVGLDIKRELLRGHLSSLSSASLPAVSALGGMMVPALIFAAFNLGSAALRGWAIPSATDIAFSLAVLRIFGKGLPDSLGVFLTALAVLDDFGAIVIIALFYGESVSLLPLACAIGVLAYLALLAYLGIGRLWPYVIGGLCLWLAILSSGIHPTVAGVLLAFTIPLDASDQQGRKLRERISSGIAPWVTLLILPLFALVNAGVPLAGLSLGELSHPVVLGIALGLFLGKQIGVLGFGWLSIKAGLCEMPDGASWRQFYGVAILTGIGFTMSLFTAGLAFPDAEMAPLYRLGVIAGSLLSTLFGALFLWWLRRGSKADTDNGGGSL